LRNVRLKFEDPLQRPLRNLGLIWRVSGVELGARDQGIDNDRNVVAIDAGADERWFFDRILPGLLLEVVDEFRFGEGFRNIQ